MHDAEVEVLFGCARETPPVHWGGAGQRGNRGKILIRGELGDFRAFARSLVVSDIADLIDRVSPLGDGSRFVYPTACLRHFDEIEALPRGFVSLGDSLCNLNPSYGQGITSAALQAEALNTALGRDAPSLPRRYYELAVEAARLPFNLSWSADLDLPGVVAPPNPTPAPIRAYLKRAMRMARNDPSVALAIRRIMGLTDTPPALLKPNIAFRVLFGSASIRRGAPSLSAAVPTESSTAR